VEELRTLKLPFQSSGSHALSPPPLCLFVVCGESSSKFHDCLSASQLLRWTPFDLSPPPLCLFIVCGGSSSKFHHCPSASQLLRGKPFHHQAKRMWRWEKVHVWRSGHVSLTAASSLCVVRALWLCAAGPPACPVSWCSTSITR
jgi:hypothetical protein